METEIPGAQVSGIPHNHNEFQAQVRSVLQAGTITVEAPSPTSPSVPWELCFTPYDWTDRTEKLTELVKLLDCDEPRPVLINGPSGSGKTALVGVAVARLKALYPGGVLHLEPGRYTTDEELRSGLERLGENLSNKSSISFPRMYRSALAERRMIVVLDEPSHPKQIEDFWPQAPEVAYIILSSKRFRWRHADMIELPPLDTDHAIALLAAAEGLGPEISAKLVEAFGGLPGVLLNAGGIVAAKAVSVEELVELASNHGETDCFLHAFESLSDVAQRVYCALSGLPDPDFHTSLLEMYSSTTDNEGPFGELIDRRLVIRVGSERWRLRLKPSKVVFGRPT